MRILLIKPPLNKHLINDNELRELNKKTTVQTNNEAIRILKKLGINISAHLIVNPEYTEDDFQKLYRKCYTFRRHISYRLNSAWERIRGNGNGYAFSTDGISFGTLFWIHIFARRSIAKLRTAYKTEILR